MCSPKKLSAPSFELSQFVSLVLLIVSILSLVSCSNQPVGKQELSSDTTDFDHVNPVNAPESSSGYLRFNWSKIILPADNLDPFVPRLHSSNKNTINSITEYQIFLPEGKSVKDYTDIIIKYLAECQNNQAEIENQLTTLFKKNVFELGISSTNTLITIEKNLASLEILLCSYFKIEKDKLVVNNDLSTLVSSMDNFKFGKHLFASLIKNDNPAFEAIAYIPNGYSEITFVKKCVSTLNKKKSIYSLKDTKTASKFLMKKILLNLKSKPDKNDKKCKWSEILAEFKTYGFDNEKLISKEAKNKLQTEQVWTDQEYVIFLPDHFLKLFVSFKLLVSNDELNSEQIINHFSLVNNSSNINGKDECELFPKFVAALSTNPFKYLIDLNEKSSEIGLFVKNVGSIRELEDAINEALGNQKLPEDENRTLNQLDVEPKNGTSNESTESSCHRDLKKSLDKSEKEIPADDNLDWKKKIPTKSTNSFGLKFCFGAAAIGMIGLGLYYVSK